ncbi:leucine-rich repeat domain-containing protein, partial [Chloroflexota bacterium]
MKRRKKFIGGKAQFGLTLILCLLAGMVASLLPVQPITKTTLADGAWQIQTVDSEGEVGQYSSLSFDGSGNPAVSYYDNSNGDLKYAHWDGSSWDITTVDTGGDVGWCTSLAFDNSGNPSISYIDVSSHYLKLARWNGSSWSVAIVDDSGEIYDETSLAFDSAGNPAISYCYWEDVFLGSDIWYVRYAHFDGISWNRTNVRGGAGVYVGRYNSLAFDASGNPSITYYNHGSYNLEYAHWNGSSWVIDTVDTLGDVGMYTSLAFDSSGNPGISYYDYSSTNLKYVHWNGSSWNIETVDSNGNVGLYTSLGFDNHGNPTVSYYDETNGNLKYAYWSGVGWTLQTPDSVGDVGQFDSLAFDSSGNPAISYYDVTNAALKYAYLPLNQSPDQPVNMSPSSGATGVSLMPTLQSSAFSDPDAGDTHAASQWQITTTSGDYSSPVYDSSTDSSNLTAISIPLGRLIYGKTYYWRARYQDNYSAWSDWSLETSFTTSADGVVTFMDANLEAAIREAIAKPAGDIYKSDLTGLTDLGATEKSIADLTGLEHCTSLTELRLQYNQISNISPLANLTSLTSLKLYNNQISDITPLANLTSLISLELENNQISVTSSPFNMNNLTYLDLRSNQISDVSFLANLTSLTYL